MIEKSLLEFPEVRGIVTKLGRPDLATEAMGVYEADVYVLLKPRDQWTTARTKESFIQKLADRLERIPGVEYNFTQPMAMRLDEVVSGIKADVAVKIFGEDTAALEQLGEHARKILRLFPARPMFRPRSYRAWRNYAIAADRASTCEIWLERVGRTGDR